MELQMRKWASMLVAASMLLPPVALPESSRAEGMSPFVEEGPVRTEVNRWAVVPEWTQSPTIDGVLSETLWEQAAVLDDFQNVYTSEPASGDARYRVAYDSMNLYIGGSLLSDYTEALSQIEFVISPSEGGSMHGVASIPIHPERTITTEWNMTVAPSDVPQRTNLTGFPYATANDTETGRFSLEMAIPFAALGLSEVTAGDEWRLNVIHVANVNTQPMSSWMPIRTSRMIDRSGGAVTLAGNVVDAGALGSVFFTEALGERWLPASRELMFVGLTDMRLAFELPTPSGYAYRLDWKAPEGYWEELADATASVSGSTVTIDFTHPFPQRSGIYQLRLLADNGLPGGMKEAIFSFHKEELVKGGLDALAYVPTFDNATAVVYEPPSPRVEETLLLIPEQNGFDFIGLPEMPELSPEDLYTLSMDGQSMISKRTNTVYPNPAYPENQVLTAIGRNNIEVSYPYYEDSEGKRYFLTAHLWYLQKMRAIEETETISKTDPLGAARLLYRFAQTYENYVPTADQRWYNRPLNLTSGPPYNYWGGMWNTWYINDLNTLRPLFRAFAAVRQTDALEVLGSELGVDVEQKIVQDMFLPSISYVLSFPETLGNLSSYLWNGLIEAGKALKQPEYIHMAVESMNNYAEKRFLPDGAWYEVTVSYHNQATNGLISSIKLLNGYSDPEGYLSPRTGKRFDQLNLYNEFPILDKARSFPKTLVYPDNKVLPLQDTWASTNVSDPAANRGSLLLPSAGIGRLSLGEGARQTQLYMQFTPKYGHNHYDPLSLNLFAEGQELLPDLGYTHSKYRYFTISTIGHNTVVVNSRNMSIHDGSRPGGRVKQFADQLEESSFQAMHVSQREAYPETSEYSREPWLIAFPDDSGKGYVLDLFRVSGGDRHEYTLQGDANRDAYFLTDLPLSDYGPRLLPPGVEAVEAESQSQSGSAEGHYPGYIYVKDVKQAELPGDRYQVTLATYGTGGKTAKLNVTGLLEDGDNELFLGRSPSIRSTRIGGREYDNNDDVSQHDMPKLVLRRDGTDLASTFATVLEPYADGQTARIEGIDRLVPDQAPSGARAYRITYGDTTDIVLSNPHHPEQLMVIGDISMRGEMGFIRLIGGTVEEMRLIGGTLLQKGSAAVTGAGPVTGTIVETRRTAEGDPYNALVTDTAVSPELVGRSIIVQHPDQVTRGYKIGSIVPNGGKTDIVLAGHDPGFTIYGDGHSELNYYPAKQWMGTHSFRIANDDVWDGGPVAEQLPFGTVSGVVYDPLGVPNAGAVVRVSGYTGLSANTDGDGKFTLVSVPTGLRRATVTTTAYAKTVSDVVYVGAGQTAHVTIQLLAEAPPELTGVPAASGAGMPLAATSSKSGTVYLVPDATLPYLDAIQNAATASGASAAALPGVPIAMDTTGLAPGAYRLFAADQQQVLSAGHPVQLVATGLAVIDDTHASIQYTGNWVSFSSESYYGGTARRAQSVDAFADIPFYGSQAVILGNTSIHGGYADIYIDGVWQAEVDTYSSSSRYQQTLYESAELPEGAHTLRIVASGEKREAAINPYVSLDAVRVLQADQIPPRLTDATSGPLTAGLPVTATSSKNAAIYLVPHATEATRSAIEAAGSSANGRTVAATAGIPVTLGTSGLATDLYRLYAIDGNGNVSTASDGIAVLEPAAADVEDDSATIAYSGTWLRLSNASYSGGTVNRGGSAGAYADIPFYGTSAQLLGTLHVNNGQANIYIDGVYRMTIDLYSGSTRYQQVLYETGPLSEGLHVLRVEAAWTKHPSAQNYYIPLDALRVFSQPELYDVTEGPLTAGQNVQATSTKDANLYLVPASTAATKTAIEAAGGSANGRTTAVTAGVAGTLDTTGLATDRYRLYAIDASDTVAAGPAAGIVVVKPEAAKLDDQSAVIAYSGAWTRLSSANYWEGTVNRGQSAGAYADIPFYGTSAQLLGTKHVNNGQANIYIDGVYQTTVDLYSGSTRYQQVLYDTGSLSEGLHVLRVEATWTRHPSAQNYYVIVDALESFVE